MTCCALTGSGRQGRIGRPGMADAVADALGTRVSAGESCPAIGRALGTPVGSIDGRVRLRGGDKAAGAPAGGAGPDTPGAQGNLTRPCGRAVGAVDRASARSSAGHEQSREDPAWRVGSVPGARRGRAGVAPRQAAHALSGGAPRAPARHRPRDAPGALVAGADRGSDVTSGS